VSRSELTKFQPLLGYVRTPALAMRARLTRFVFINKGLPIYLATYVLLLLFIPLFELLRYYNHFNPLIKW
jgi:hypothetical protein